MYAWQFAKALYLADLHGWTRFVSMQDHYNLLNREEEREMLPLCAAEGIGVIPWSPQARGRLSRPWKAEETERSRSDNYGRTLYEATEGADRAVVERVAAVAGGRGLPMAQVALAWILGRSAVTAPIVGATKPGQLEDAAAAVSLRLTDDELRSLEEPYVPHRIAGFE